jgi:nucleotide-binding universal stress UspA family protein
MRVEKILHPTDLSAASRPALHAAVFFAELFDAELVILHLLVPKHAELADPQHQLPKSEELQAELRAIAESPLGPLVQVAAEAPLRVREVVETAMDESRGILERAEAEAADLLVLGTHGRKGLAHALAGSVSGEVIRGAHCPVVTIAAGARPFERLARIVVADDFSPGARRALDHAAQLARRSGAALDLVHALEIPVPLPAPAPMALPYGEASVEELESAARETLNDDRARHASGLAGENVVLLGGGAPALVEHVAEREADLLVQGTAGRSGLNRILLGSFAEQSARLARCAVLTVPSRAAVAT